MTTWHALPYGVSSLGRSQAVELDGERVRCCIRGCDQSMAKAHRGTRRDVACFCPEHHIRVSPSRPTYVYDTRERNLIVDHHVFRSVAKVESWRLPNETSEDALTWNVFVGLSRLGRLRQAVWAMVGILPHAEPTLYLWGNEIGPESARFWPKLKSVREMLEPDLGIKTEPDIVLHAPGELMVIVEAKFGSPNSTLDKKNGVPVAHFLDRYHTGQVDDPLDRGWLVSQPPIVVLEQLTRMAVFGSWLSTKGEQVVVVNLVRKNDLIKSPPVFDRHLLREGRFRFQACAWEQLIPPADGASDDTLHRYLLDKSYALKPAFQLT